MGNVLNDEIIRKSKLDYILFKKSKTPVPIKMIQFDTAGYVHELINGKLDRNLDIIDRQNPRSYIKARSYMFDEISAYDCNGTFDSIIFEASISGFEGELQLTDIGTTYVAQSSSGNNGESKTSEAKTNICPYPTKIEPIDISNNNAVVVVLFPNSMLLPLIRIYVGRTPNSIDILDIEDKNCAYNSYYSNISVYPHEVIKIEKPSAENISFMKYDADKSVSSARSLLDAENYTDGEYHNETIDLKVKHTENDTSIILAGENLSYIKERCLEKNNTKKVDEDWLANALNIAEELYAVRSTALVCDVYVSEFGKYFGFKLSEKESLDFEICGSYGFIKYVVGNTCKISLVNFDEGDIVSEMMITNLRMCMYGQAATDIKGLSYVYFIDGSAIDLSLSVAEIIHKIYLENINHSELIHGTSNTDGMIKFRRGLLGEIIK